MADLPRAILFDAYGTLLDVAATAEAAEALFPGYGRALSGLWRDKQLAYSWLRTLGGRHADFAAVTADALDHAAASLGLALAPAAREGLIGQYRRLPAFPDVRPALNALGARGVPLAVLSNGTPEMLEAALGAAGLGELLAGVLSIEAAGRYKPAPEAYALGPRRFGAAAHEMLFVSSNGWDIAGAGWFGYRTFWVNRTGQPAERLGATPTATGSELGELVRWLEAE
jgi:2-haloacid dehalogenase